MFTTLFIGLSIMAFSQMVDTTTYVYCKAVCISNITTTLNRLDAVEIYLDFGNGKVFNPKNPMKDEVGKEADFDSAVDLINFMSDRKWILDKAYQSAIVTSVVRLMTTFMFKKPKYKVF